MIGLLHSETFRKNLSKWIFMYVAVLCLLSSVITYSKYISNMSREEGDVRTSKFIIDVTNIPTDESCLPTDTNESIDLSKASSICSTTSIRPSGEVESYFIVDTSKLEVNADIYVRVSSSNNIDVLRVEQVNKTNEKIADMELTKNEDGEGQIFTVVVDDIGDVDRETITYYRVVTKRKLTSDTTWNIDENEIHHLYIGYSAFQRK